MHGELVFRHAEEGFPGLYRSYHEGNFSLFYVVNDASLSHHNLLYKRVLKFKCFFGPDEYRKEEVNHMAASAKLFELYLRKMAGMVRH